MFSFYLQLINILKESTQIFIEENMHIKSILNRIEKLKGFVYVAEHLTDENGHLSLDVVIRPRVGSRGYCGGCGKQGPTYDTGNPRRFQYIPFWGILVFFIYALRRIDCKACGVTREMIPWAEGKNQLTTSFRWYLAHWAKKLSWKDAAISFFTSWNSVARSVEMAVKWGRSHLNLSGITSLGVDEVQWKSGHKYLTLVYQIDKGRRRLLWIGKDRSEESFREFFTWFGPERTALIEFICSDMWKPFIKVIREYASSAVHVLDRFHIMTHISKAIDEIRAGEHRALLAKGLEILTNSRWCLLKREENMTDRQRNKLKELLQYNLKSIRAYLLKEDFHQFWNYTSPAWAENFLNIWTARVMKSRLEPMKKVAKMLRRYQPEIANYFRAKKAINQGCVEGLNNKVKSVIKKSYGFREYKTIELALYHGLGDLPEPKFTHRFW